MRRTLLCCMRRTGSVMAIFICLCLAQLLSADVLLATGQENSFVDNTVALDVMFVVDNSGSMRKNDPSFITRKVVTDFSRNLTENARFGMVIFDKNARLVAPLRGKEDSRALSEFTKNTDHINYRGLFTNSPAGIERALYELKMKGREAAEKVIVFLTDGIVDTGSPQQDAKKEQWLREDLAADSENAGVRIFGIAFTDGADVRLIQTLALKTRGEYFRAYTAEDIPVVFEKINAHIAAPAVAVIPQASQEVPDIAPEVPIVAKDEAEAYASPELDDQRPVWKNGMVLAAVVIALAFLGTVLIKFIKGNASSQKATTSVKPSSVPPVSINGAMPDAELVDLQHILPNASATHVLHKNRITVGRDPANDIVIAKETISSLHATIEFKNGYFFVEDHRSTNGTYLNKKKIGQNMPVELKSGDKISFAVYEFQFLMIDQAPVGETVMLSSSSFPMGSDPLATKPFDGAVDDAELFRQCLRQHLDRVADLGEGFKKFTHDYFDDNTIQGLCTRIKDLMVKTQSDLDEHGSHHTSPPVFYQLWTLPVELKHARTWYTRKHGGYIKFLTRLLESESFKENNCTVLCLITYGRTKEAWVSMTIVPTQKDAEQVEIISVEFLTEEEKENLSVSFGELGRIV